MRSSLRRTNCRAARFNRGSYRCCARSDRPGLRDCDRRHRTLPGVLNVSDVARVPQEVTNDAKRTTLLCSDDGVRVVRPVAVDQANDRRNEGLLVAGG
jgi:hypothetical protein